MSDTAHPGSPPIGGGQLVVFSVAGDEFALPIAKVQEIIRYIEPRQVGGADASIAGVISLRGKIIPVFDLALRLGHAAHREPDAKIVIVDSDAGTAGIVVDDVADVLTIDAAHLDDAPDIATAFMAAIAQVGERLVVVLDAEVLFGGLDLIAAAAA
jgi:purine-binding chemotaxis protein CheW